MPIYPGDRVPADRQRDIERAERREAALGLAATYLGDLIVKHHQLIMANCPQIVVRAKIPSKVQSRWKNTLYDVYERDAWVLWQRKFMDAIPKSPDVESRRPSQTGRLIVTPQQQVATLLSSELRDTNSFDSDFYTIGTKRCTTQLRGYLADYAHELGDINEQTVGTIIASIEARVYGVDREDS